MVRKYIKKSRRRMWSTEAMKMAIEAVIKQGLSIKKASIENEVPQATLSRKIHQCRCDPDKSIDLVMHPKASNFQTVFTKEQELILCQYINMLEDQLVGLTTIDIRRLAFQVAEKLRIPHRFNRDIETAGEDWYRGFLKRNPRVTLKRVDHLSEKNRELNKNRVYRFFDLLEGTINKYDLKASDVYNVDETVITCLPKYDSNIESIEFEEFASAEQNKLVTAVICLCANGDHLPLLLIFPCLKKCKTLVKGAPPGAWAEFHPTGQMHLSIFIKWLKKFIHFSKATRDSPVLLILDGYRSYLKDLQVLEIIQENGVNVICVPSQFGDKLQPIRLNFMTCLSKTYSSEIMKWIRSNPNCIVSMNQIYQHFGNAFLKVLKIATPASCFHDTGIWPVDRNLFNKDVDRSAKTESLTKEKKLHPSSEPHKSAAKVTQKITNTDDFIKTFNVNNNVVNKPIIFITQNNTQPYILQSLPLGKQENIQVVQQSIVQPQYVQQQVRIVNTDNAQAIKAESVIKQYQTTVDDNTKQNKEMSTVVIPREARLSEVKAEDLQKLVQSPEKLYFYVSPCRLNLLS